MKGFFQFIRSQGVVGLAVGFIMGGSITKLITSLVNDIINPFVGLLIGATAGDLASAYFQIGSSKIFWGSFISNRIDFIIVAFIVYFGVKILRIDIPDSKDKKKK